MTAPLEPEPVSASFVEKSPKAAARPRIGVIGTLALVALSKLKLVVGLLKALPAGKLMLTSFSMVAMIAVEATRNGWLFGLGFVLLILVHELGHGYAMKRAGVEAGWPIFIPFFGAMINMKGEVRDRGTEAHIAYGGPLAGAAASLVTAAVGLLTASKFFFSLAYVGFFLNLFNMTPLSPLDGGRVAQAFSRHAWIVGLILLAGMFWLTGTPQLLLIGFLALSRVFSRSTSDPRPELAAGDQRLWAIRYFGLSLFMAAAMHLSGVLSGRT